MRFKVLAAAATLALSLSAPAAAKWREASTQHFVIYSEGSESSLRKFAERLERYDAAMRHTRGLPNEDLGPANRLTVYVVPSTGMVQKLAGDKKGFVAGFYVPRASGSIAIIPRNTGGGEWDLDAETVLLHEYAHHFLFQNYPGAYPAWFTEGFAEFYSTAKFEENGGVGLGMPAKHRAWGLMSGDPLPLSGMMSPVVEKLSPEQREALYGRGWLLTHYLAFEKSRAGQLTGYLRALNSGKSGGEAATSAFGDLKVLGDELDAYMRRSRLSYLQIGPNSLSTGPIALREVSAGEDAVMDAKIRSRRGVNREQALTLLSEMRRLAAPYPNDPAVQATLAEAEYDAGYHKEAEAAADRALAAQPKHSDALIYKARARMSMAARSRDPGVWREVRALIRAANQVDPEDPEPLILFYRSYREEGIAPTKNAVEGLVYAYELAPQDLSLRMETARQFLIDGKVSEARTALTPIAYHPHAGDMRDAALAVMKALEAGAAAEGLKAWRGPRKEGEEASGS